MNKNEMRARHFLKANGGLVLHVLRGEVCDCASCRGELRALVNLLDGVEREAASASAALKHGLDIACRRGCDHCAQDIRQARAISAEAAIGPVKALDYAVGEVR